jgi:hypothetical protein
MSSFPTWKVGRTVYCNLSRVEWQINLTSQEVKGKLAPSALLSREAWVVNGENHTTLARVRFPYLGSYVSWVVCWFSRLLRGFFRVLRFSLLRKNQYFKIPVGLPGIEDHQKIIYIGNDVILVKRDCFLVLFALQSHWNSPNHVKKSDT